MADYLDFYTEKKHCRHCQRYVPFLTSLNRSYCAVCGEVVNLFSKEDWKKFRRQNAAAATPKKKSFLHPTGKKKRAANGS